MRKEADAAKQLLSVPDGDHLTLLNVYNEYQNSAYCSDLILPVTDENIVIQIYTTAIGPGTTISRPVPFLKQTTSAPNFSESWSASKLTL
jgi:hypothetical protein